MEPDIRIIRLSRMTVEGKKKRQDMPKDVAKDDCWYVTDYFDRMQINRLSLNQPFAEWLDIRQNSNKSYQNSSNDHEIAAQSYTLYCSTAMLEHYENPDEKNQKIKKYRKNPFEEAVGLECLSIIQVYITPEIWARMEENEKNICNKDGIILPSFIKDIYDTLDVFSSKNSDDVFTARVYMMLSAGDFAIVVRSKKPDTAYHISTYLRERRAERVGESRPDDEYVLYKTYTFSTIGKLIIDCEEVQNETDMFILRGCYSNLYWKNQDKVKEFLTEFQEGIKEFYPISGRYDFTVRLTEEEFYQVMSSNTEGVTGKGGKQSELVQYLKFLIDKEYLSYINERYLMAKLEEKSELTREEKVSKSVFLRKDGGKLKDLFDQNNCQIEKLIERQKKITEESQSILGYRKNIQQYLFLLKREISLCKSTNELSDTRIYTKVLAEQLETVLDSAGRYILTCSQIEKNDEWINTLEDHLRKSVVTLDSYAQYIRNNNLQSLQTPNYNIETSMGVEKILIGYSELLWSFIEFYQQVMYSEEKTMEEKKIYLPVMVPNLHDRDVNVEVMFPERELTNMEEMGADRDSDRKCLMVIESPTLEEVTDFSIMFSALFHEVAHQLRYEERKERNQAVLKAAVREVMRGVAEYSTEIVLKKIGAASDDADKLCAGLTNGLTKAFIEIKYSDENSDELEDKSLLQFGSELYDNINQLFAAWLWESNLETRTKEFIFELRYELDSSDEKIHGLLGELNEAINGQLEDIDRVVKCAFYLAGESASRYLDEMTMDRWNREKSDEGDNLWDLKWKRVFGGIKGKEIPRISRAFTMFLTWVDGYEEQLAKLDYSNHDSWKRSIREAESFEAKLYSYMKEYWGTIRQQSASVYGMDEEKEEDISKIPSFRYWTRVGRYLGLDYEEDARKKFSKAIKEALTWQNLDFEPSLLSLYREETADLLMWNVMQMKPIEYLNLAASLFVPSNGFYRGTVMERVFCVLYVQWCYVPKQENENTKKMAWETYRTTYGEIFKEARESSRKILSEAGIVESTNDVLYEDIPCEDDVKMFEKAENIIKREMAYLMECRDEIIKMSDGQEKIKITGELDNFRRLYNLLIDLIWNGRYYWNKLHDNEELFNDLVKGSKELSKLKEKADRYHNPEIKEIFKIGNFVSEYQLHSYSRKDMEEGGELNQRCVELLLTMYYHNKIRIAQGRREEYTDGN